MSSTFEISNDPARLDLDVICGFLQTSYWAAGRPRAVIERAIRSSLCFGGYVSGRQVAFARVATDTAVFAYLMDVFVLPEHRGKGYSKRLMEAVMAHPSLQDLRLFLLATRDAHGLYQQFGFAPLGERELWMARRAVDRPPDPPGHSTLDTTTAPADLRYPLGPWPGPMDLTSEQRTAAIADIAALPIRMRRAVHGLSEAQLETPYRPGGWTVRQVVHHVADSHMHALLRLKLALTEDTPTIKPYDEGATAMLADAGLPIDVSLGILDGVHARWTAVYKGMTAADWFRAFVHPERDQPMTLSAHLQLYSWHSRHHVAHIVALRRREGW